MGILRCLRGTINHELVYQKTANPLQMDVYVDASWGTHDGAKSVHGYTVMVNGALVAWRAKTNQHVTLSTMESELVAIGEGSGNQEFGNNHGRTRLPALGATDDLAGQ